tara:strand:- start:67 stop:240 length:174 start_codon:yes stop_codon:yes gene_type:complete
LVKSREIEKLEKENSDLKTNKDKLNTTMKTAEYKSVKNFLQSIFGVGVQQEDELLIQ